MFYCGQTVEQRLDGSTDTTRQFVEFYFAFSTIGQRREAPPVQEEAPRPSARRVSPRPVGRRKSPLFPRLARLRATGDEFRGCVAEGTRLPSNLL